MKLEGMLFIGGGKQGQIKNAVTPHCYIVAIFSWLDGYTTHYKVVNIQDMEMWSLYDNEERFQEEAQEYLTRLHSKQK